jgi:hypothetical protein
MKTAILRGSMRKDTETVYKKLEVVDDSELIVLGKNIHVLNGKRIRAFEAVDKALKLLGDLNKFLAGYKQGGHIKWMFSSLEEQLHFIKAELSIGKSEIPYREH